MHTRQTTRMSIEDQELALRQRDVNDEEYDPHWHNRLLPRNQEIYNRANAEHRRQKWRQDRSSTDPRAGHRTQPLGEGHEDPGHSSPQRGPAPHSVGVQPSGRTCESATAHTGTGCVTPGVSVTHRRQRPSPQPSRVPGQTNGPRQAPPTDTGETNHGRQRAEHKPNTDTLRGSTYAGTLPQEDDSCARTTGITGPTTTTGGDTPGQAAGADTHHAHTADTLLREEGR